MMVLFLLALVATPVSRGGLRVGGWLVVRRVLVFISE